MSFDEKYAKALDHFFTAFSNPSRRKCLDAHDVKILLANGDVGRGTMFCEREYGHPLPHHAGGQYSWPSREEIMASQE